MKAKNEVASLSYLVATRWNCLSLLKKHISQRNPLSKDGIRLICCDRKVLKSPHASVRCNFRKRIINLITCYRIVLRNKKYNIKPFSYSHYRSLNSRKSYIIATSNQHNIIKYGNSQIMAVTTKELSETLHLSIASIITLAEELNIDLVGIV